MKEILKFDERVNVDKSFVQIQIQEFIDGLGRPRGRRCGLCKILENSILFYLKTFKNSIL